MTINGTNLLIYAGGSVIAAAKSCRISADVDMIEAAGQDDGKAREFVPAMAQAAKAFGANAFFFEVHPDPDNALSDGPNMLQLSDLEGVIAGLI